MATIDKTKQNGSFQVSPLSNDFFGKMKVVEMGLIKISTTPDSIQSIKKMNVSLNEKIEKIPTEKLEFSTLENAISLVEKFKTDKKEIEKVITLLKSADQEILLDAKDVCVLLDSLISASKQFEFLIDSYSQAIAISQEKQKMKKIKAISVDELLNQLN